MEPLYFDTIDSTNELAKRMVREGRIRGAAYLVAREQTAGRGSRGRGWVSPKDAGIYLTIVDLPASASARNTTLFTLATGVACAEVLREATGLDVRLKPINDLFLEGAKLGGILTEAIVQGDALTALLTGIGINTHLAPREIGDAAPKADGAPPAQSAPPTSLQEHMPVDAFAHLVMTALLQNLVERATAWHSVVWRGEISKIEARWNELRITGAPECDALAR